MVPSDSGIFLEYRRVMGFDDQSLLGVPDEITDMTRSLEMVER